ncbi:hypothetical protein Cme02nite_28100 [Catellatospora methionotrophica]|uniref:Uncharacterized protein n=1 Tax=Catellatospora methionotrophica TaxID=121620 RepID=A0A8J3PFL2_9ACTN|nr:hypothetical protein Cme02nite_28100 [Catellatospora methionotrophica]
MTRQRVDTAQDFACRRTPVELIGWCGQQAAQVVARAAGTPGSRLVATRHGGAGTAALTERTILDRHT